MSRYIIIKNGLVIDPETKKIEKKEIGIIDNRIAAVKDVLVSGKPVQYVDAEGSYVAPGFIDLHVHVFENVTTLGIEADLVGIKQGVTTVVDAGSSGYNNYPLFKETVIKKSKTEIFSFLNISRSGLGSGLSELADPKDLMTVDEAKELYNKEQGIVGLKARMSGSVVKKQGINPLQHARELADVLELPIMVHIGNPPPQLDEIFPLLGKGDIVTHAFHGKKDGILDSNNRLIGAAEEALKRGVLLDVGHGTSSFSFKTIGRFKNNYSIPFTISTDIYLGNYENPVGSLMVTMSKFLAMGYTLEDVVSSVTKRAAEAIGLQNQGTLSIGSKADLTIFTIEENPEELTDAEGVVFTAKKILQPKITVKDGKVVCTHD